MRRLPSRRRLVLAVVVGALVAVGVALGTPAIGTVTATPLADVNTANTARMNYNGIEFNIDHKVRVLHVKNVGSPGFSAGWHKHNGPVFIALTAGQLTFYDRAGAGCTYQGCFECRVTTVTAPGGYIETAGTPIQVYNTTPSNVNGGNAEWVTTQVIPIGAATRVDVTPGFCGV
jgi:hypothetical protein